MLRGSCQGGWLRAMACLYVGLALARCTDPNFRELDASGAPGQLDDAAQAPMPDGARPGSDAGDQASDASGFHDAGVDPLEARMQSMVGKYFMRLYFNAKDGPGHPLIKGYSTVEIRQSASGLEMEEQPCHYWGTAKTLFDYTATTEFEAKNTPSTIYQLTYNGKAFDAERQGHTTLGYDAAQPPGCASSQSLPSATLNKPWLNGADCTCPSNLLELPETKKLTDCRINDDDKDGFPGVTLVGLVQGFEPVDMYVVQRSKDQYLDLDFKNAQQRRVLLANFYTTRIISLLGCPPPDDGVNCTLTSPPACPAEYSRAEFVRLSEDQTFSCDGLYEAEAVVGLFNEQAPSNCEP